MSELGSPPPMPVIGQRRIPAAAVEYIIEETTAAVDPPPPPETDRRTFQRDEEEGEETPEIFPKCIDRPKIVRQTSLIVIVGPMGSGKTSEAQRLARSMAHNESVHVLCVGSKLDKARQRTRRQMARSADNIQKCKAGGKIYSCDKCGSREISSVAACGEDCQDENEEEYSAIETHGGERMPAVLCDKLEELFSSPMFAIADWLVIDEGQFFSDLVPFVERARNMFRKSLIVATLDATYEMKPFVDLNYLVTHATQFYKLTSTCAFCTGVAAHTIAFFETEKDCKIAKSGSVVVGGMDVYAPACYVHATMPRSQLPNRRKKTGLILSPALAESPANE